MCCIDAINRGVLILEQSLSLSPSPFFFLPSHSPISRTFMDRFPLALSLLRFSYDLPQPTVHVIKRTRLFRWVPEAFIFTQLAAMVLLPHPPNRLLWRLLLWLTPSLP